MVLTKHMNFQRYGRSYHLAIADAADLEAAVGLDEAHWVATNAPISTINCDATFLQLLDADGNGRITCHELREGISWLLEVLSEHSGISQAIQVLQLEAVRGEDAQGQKIRQAAGKMLRTLGLQDAQEITLGQVRQVKADVESKPVSEAGVVLPEAAKQADIREFIADVVGKIGGVSHPSGAQGINQPTLEEFISQAGAFLRWHERGQLPPGQERTDIMPLGKDTPAAYAILGTVRDKIEQFFAQCTVLALEERFIERMGWTESEVQELDLDDPAVIEEVLRKAPLAKATASGVLNFTEHINPYYSQALEQFRREVAGVVLKEVPGSLTAEQWRTIKSFFAAHEAWVQARPAAAVASLGEEKLRSYLDERFASSVKALIARSRETALVLDNIRLVEKLVLYQAYMMALGNNFVSFPHLYDPERRAMFEMGTLVMDGRRFNLAVKAVNRAEHTEVAKTSNMFVLYVEVTPKDAKAKYEVAVPVTSGNKGNLCVGKRGVFYDLAGKEADARVVSIIDNPISLKEALLAPFVRLGRMLTGKIESITAEAEKQFDKQASGAMTQATTATAKAGPGGLGGSTGGMLLGAGVAIAALGSALAYVTKTISENPWRVLIALGVAVVAVMVPISIVAYLKLRRRDVSPILEGSGWGINARMRLTRKQGKSFTERPGYPLEAEGIVRVPWWMVVALAVILAVVAGGGYLLFRFWGKSGEPEQQSISQSTSVEQGKEPVPATGVEEGKEPPGP